MFFRRSPAPRRMRSRLVLNSSPPRYLRPRRTHGSERRSAMISAELLLKSLSFSVTPDPPLTPLHILYPERIRSKPERATQRRLLGQDPPQATSRPSPHPRRGCAHESPYPPPPRVARRVRGLFAGQRPWHSPRPRPPGLPPFRARSPPRRASLRRRSRPHLAPVPRSDPARLRIPLRSGGRQGCPLPPPRRSRQAGCPPPGQLVRSFRRPVLSCLP